MDDNSEKALALFLSIGLDEKTARKTFKKKGKISTDLTALIHQAGVTDGCDPTIGDLLYMIADKYPGKALVHRPTLLKYIVSSKIKSSVQLGAAVSFLTKIGPDDLNLNELEEACGVGVDVSLEDIERTVEEILQENMNTILEMRYRTDAGLLIEDVMTRLRWADRKTVKRVIEGKMYELLGERTADDNGKPTKEESAVEAVVEAVPHPSDEELNPFSIFPHPKQNFAVHTKVVLSDTSILEFSNTKELLEKHLKVTGGEVYTRFPPEPNGYLHIGHAKAMFVNFGLAKERGGCCYLRYDDTNPEAERKEYINHIDEIVKWMGWEPFKITYTSDYFQELYDLAVELIRRGHAYVDHQNAEEIKEYREKKMKSPWRDRPIEESLKLFDEMRRGLVEEGKATLRMKQDMQNDNYNMYDLIAYRIKFTPHPHAGDKWCIYPTYDFAHCIVDSLENITHSLNYIVTNKYVDGWDDPRLLTLAGLRRRGVTPSAINAFVRGLGITRSDGSMIHMSRLEHHITKELDATSPRTMVVLDPLKVVITNMEPGEVIERDAKRWPNDKNNDDPSAIYKVPFSKVIYIEKSDFQKEDSKGYHGLAYGKTVFLKYGCLIKCTKYDLADDGETVCKIYVEYSEGKPQGKGILHWVPEKDMVKVEIRKFEKLFNSENPAELNDDWLTDINPNSKVVVSDAYALSTIKDAVVGDRFQFERMGYFAVDKDSRPGKLVFNQTVTLKDSYKKGGKGVK